MKISEDIKIDLNDKNQKLLELKKHLKCEFVGIDYIIDNVIDSMTPFYLFPDSLKRPIVINLWGMTGTGKTSLIEKIVDFLKLSKSYLKFDIGEYSSSEDKLRKDLANKINKISESNNIIVFDEFQLGRTISEDSREIDRNSLRPLWELLDSGIIYTYNTGIYFGLIELVDKIKKCIELDVQVDDEGWVTKNEEIYNSLFSKDYCYRPCDYKTSLVLDDELSTEDTKIYLDSTSEEAFYENKGRFKNPRFFKKDFFDDFFYNANPVYFNKIKEFSFHKNIFYKSLHKLIKFIEKDFFDNISLLEKKDYSKSLIFCLGNLDEVYQMSHNVNPDEDADIFHEHSLKITLPQIKDALSNRFRMEQIGRLGNIHYIYPSLSKNSYKEIIKINLNKHVNYLKKEFDLDIIFDSSVNDILYKEGVYPTQGTRPLLSSFNYMINSYTSMILTELSLKLPNTTSLKWRFDNSKYIIDAISPTNTLKLEYPVECVLENLRKSDNSEIQSLVAVHEAGHALISCLKMNICPIEILSKTANLSEGLCRFDYKNIIKTKDFIYHSMMVSLGGLVAEELIFTKNNITSGSKSDLSKVTQYAFDLVKRYGMDKHSCLISADNDEYNNEVFIKTKSHEKRVLKLIKKAKKETKKILKENKKYLILLATRLAESPKLESDEIKSILEDLNINWKDSTNYHNYKNILKDEYQKII
jgi:cell division protease FtsH